MSNCLGWQRVNFFVAGLVLLLTTTARAEQPVDDWFFQGFITQGWFASDDNNFYGNSSAFSDEFTELGLNSSWRINNRFSLAGQVISRRAGSYDDGDPQLDYLLLDWQLQGQHDSQLGLRVGRIKIPYGLYNDSRDMAFTRPTIVLPQSLYFEKARDFQLSADGLMLYSRQALGGGYQWDSELLVARPKHDSKVEEAYLNRNFSGRFASSRGVMWRNKLSDDTSSWTLAATLGHFNFDYRHGDLEPFLKTGNMSVDVALLSAQKAFGRLTLTGEYSLQRVDWGELGSGPSSFYSQDPVNFFESGYLQAQYRLSRDWDLVARYDVLYFDRSDRSGRESERLYGRPFHRQFGKDFTLGVGWRPHQDWLIRAEWHSIDGTGSVSEVENSNAANLERRWQLWGLQASYRF